MESSSEITIQTHKLTFQTPVPRTGIPLCVMQSNSSTTPHPSSSRTSTNLVLQPPLKLIHQLTCLLWISYSICFFILLFSLLATFLHPHCTGLLSSPAIVAILSMIHFIALYGQIVISTPEERVAFFTAGTRAPKSRQEPTSTSTSTKLPLTWFSNWSFTRILQLSTWSIVWPVWVTLSVIALILSTTLGVPQSGHLSKDVLMLVYIVCVLSWVEMVIVFMIGWFIMRGGEKMTAAERSEIIPGAHVNV